MPSTDRHSKDRRWASNKAWDRECNDHDSKFDSAYQPPHPDEFFFLHQGYRRQFFMLFAVFLLFMILAVAYPIKVCLEFITVFCDYARHQ